MFGPPTSRLHRQPVFAASTDCVSIADRRIVCVICTQQHSCWRTMDAWWFQWLRWLPMCVCVWGQNGSCLLWMGVFMRGGEWFLSPCCLISVQFFPCLLHAHYQSSFCCEMRSRLRTRTDGSAAPYRKLPLLWRDSPGIYVVDWLIEYDFQFRLVAMMMVPRNTFFWLFGVWVFAFSFHHSWLECAGVFMWSPSCDKISRHLGFQWCHSLILRR